MLPYGTVYPISGIFESEGSYFPGIASRNFQKRERMYGKKRYLCVCMRNIFKISLLLLPVLLIHLAAPCRAAQGDSARVRFIPMKWERLPDLNLPRAGHQVFVAGGELVAAGGHTEGFVRTATAEYFRDGAWHTVKTLYPHDWGFSLRLADGDYLVGGGCSDDFGVGQTFGVERYNPAEHRFSSFPILDIKRTLCSAALLPSGEIVVSGNWYADDAIGLSDGAHPFESEQVPAIKRAGPFIFPYGKSDAVIFGTRGERGEKVLPVVDRLHGEPYTSALLHEWAPSNDWVQMTRYDQMQVTDPATGRVSYLFKGDHPDGKLAILRFSEGVFSRVDTDYEIPTEGPWGPVLWYGSFHTDNKRGVALLSGVDEDNRMYLLSVDYRPLFSGGAVAIKVYYTKPDLAFCHSSSAILPDGRFVTVGGISLLGDPMSNYNPSAAVFAFSPFEEEPVEAGGGQSWWIWALLFIVLLAVSGFLLLRLRRKNPAAQESAEAPRLQEAQEKEKRLYHQLCQTMEKEALYKQQGLSLADVASRMRTNTKYISSCISAGAGCSFVEFVNGYRIRAAQQMLLHQPGIKMNEVSEAVGFANESSFYRNFKNAEGCTPQQWLEKEEKKA